MNLTGCTAGEDGGCGVGRWSEGSTCLRVSALSSKRPGAGAIYLEDGSFLQWGGNVTISDSQAGEQGGAANRWGELDTFFWDLCQESLQMCWRFVLEPPGDPQPGCS